MDNYYIPVETGSGRFWYMDISNLSLSSLIALKKELVGTVSSLPLDTVILEESNITFASYRHLFKRDYLRRKELRYKPVKYTKIRDKRK